MRDSLAPFDLTSYVGWHDVNSSTVCFAQQRNHIQGVCNSSLQVKGGHLGDTSDAVDILYDSERAHVLRCPRVATSNTHGTGCSLASSISAELAKGHDVLDAVTSAKRYLTAALQHSNKLMIGHGQQRPFHHGFALSDWQASKPPCDLRVYAVTDPKCNQRCERSVIAVANMLSS